jgi:hypothetical protein
MKKIYTTFVVLLAIVQVSYAQWSTGTGTIYPTTITDKIGIGTASPSAGLHIIKTTEQFRLGYDASNYTTFGVASNGLLTIGNTAGHIGLGSAQGATGLYNNFNLTGATIAYGYYASGAIQADVTTNAVYYGTSANTAATPFTATNIVHYRATQGTIGAGSSVINQYGFVAHATLTGATNNFGFRGQIPGATNRWNLFMDGTAQNYLAGYLGIGVATPVAALHLANTRNLSGGFAAQGLAGNNIYVQTNTISDGITAAGATVGIANSNTLGIPTFVATNATAGSPITITNANTLYIAGAPIGGANTNITKTLALQVASGNSSFNDNVGIGTQNPMVKLDVQGGNGSIYNTASSSNIVIGSEASGKTSIRLATSSDAGGYGTIQSVATSGSTYGNTIINPNGGNVGIGTTGPNSKLQVAGTISAVNLPNTLGSSTSMLYGSISSSSSWGVSINHVVENAGTNTYGMALLTTESYLVDRSEKVRITGSGNVGIGTTDTKGYKLAVNGSIIATSMVVKLSGNWPDYVFKPSYDLPSLTDVKVYIDKNQHLPEMPSEREIVKNGINLGELVKLQTKKIEELTLYLIEQNQRISKLEAALNKKNPTN